ncbi:hypothetical protein F7U66_02010 [Vibrio parahaemolyticus]|nr:hypothetical protein [Vibrio parahaemolyticus]
MELFNINTSTAHRQLSILMAANEQLEQWTKRQSISVENTKTIGDLLSPISEISSQAHEIIEQTMADGLNIDLNITDGSLANSRALKLAINLKDVIYIEFTGTETYDSECLRNVEIGDTIITFGNKFSYLDSETMEDIRWCIIEKEMERNLVENVLSNNVKLSTTPTKPKLSGDAVELLKRIGQPLELIQES